MSFFCWKKDDEVTPLKPRGCTDIFCLAVFFVFWAVLIFLASFAFVVGNPMRLIHGYDSFGNICGMRNERLGNMSLSGLDMTERPYVFYLNMADIAHSLKICIKHCPDQQIFTKFDRIRYEQETGVKLCRYDVENDNDEYYNLSPKNVTPNEYFKLDEQETGAGPCPKLPLYPSKPVMNRCVPESLRGLENVVYNIYSYLNSIDIVQQVVSDLYAGWYEIVLMSLVAVVLSFVMVFVIHCLASLVSWIFMTVVGVALVALTSVLWYTYAEIKLGLDSTPFTQLLEESAQNERAFLTFAILSTIVTIIILLIVLVMRRRVQLVVALFQEAGKCIRTMPLLLFQPVWTFIALFTFFLFWIFVLVALATADYPKRNKLDFPTFFHMPHKHADDALKMSPPLYNETAAFTLVSYSEPSWVHYMWWYHVIALLWTSEFILGCQQMVIAGAVASWYFTRDKENLRCSILHSVRRLVLYHMGSVAMGSFLIMMFKIPRLILTYVQSKLKKHEQYTLVRWCLCCCHCFLYCLEKFLKYLNHNAYTVIAIEGANFCTSAQVAFNAIVSNALRVAAINSVGDFTLFLGKCSVTAITACFGILIMKHNPELHFYAIPVFVIALFAFFISHCVLSVYEMVIDTLFLCFCEDYNKNDGTEGREYYAPPSLLAFMSNSSAEGESAMPLRAKSRSSDADVESIQQE